MNEDVAWSPEESCRINRSKKKEHMGSKQGPADIPGDFMLAPASANWY